MEATPALDLLPAGIAQCDAMGRITYLNARMLDWLSVDTAADYLGRPFYSLLSPAGRIYFETHLRPMLMVEGQCSEISLELVAEDGARHRIYLNGRVDRNGADGAQVIHFVCFEGTDRHRYEQELLLRRRKAETYEAMVDASPNAIINVDPDHRILTWNAAAQRLLGYSADEAMGKTLHPLIVPDAQRAEMQGQIDAVARGTPVTVETVRRHKDGSTVPVEASIARIKDERGGFAGAVSILRDITERRHNERIIKTLHREIMHRTKNLLTVVSSMAMMTQQHTRPEDFVSVFRERLLSLSNNLTLLVERNWDRIDLHELIRLQLAHLGPAALSRIEIGGEGVSLAADKAEALGMAIFELSTNALKYGALSTPGGSIHIHLEHRPDGYTLHWREATDTPITPPTRKGFGSQLTGRMLEMSVKGSVTVEYAPGGLRWRCDFGG